MLCEYEAEHENEHENHGNNEINNLSIRKAPISEKTSYLLNFSRTLIENDVNGEKLNELKKVWLHFCVLFINNYLLFINNSLSVNFLFRK